MTGENVDTPEVPRHFSSYAFYKVNPAWRRLPSAEREAHKEELTECLESWQDKIMLRTYSTVGVRPDADFLIWRATPEFELLQEQQTDLLSTNLGAWLETTYLYTSTTRESEYFEAAVKSGFRQPRPLKVTPVDRKYIIVYPFEKKREWYSLPFKERSEAMREHAFIGKKYPGIKLNTANSFGICDQEFMVAFETDSLHDFLDLMMELRGTTASQYTQRDVPIFSCIHMTPRETLDALGGVKNPALVSV